MDKPKHITPRKSLGQNFLTDKNIINKTVDALNIQDGDTVFEIGPGEGALTEKLVDQAESFFAIELDERACELLSEKFAGIEHFNLIHKDFLKFDFKKTIDDANIDISKKKIRILGNIPYYISGRIFFKLFENAKYLERAVITIQKEVAQRIVANPSSKEYGILSVLGQIVGKPHLDFDVSPNCFFPKPKVTSSVVSMDFYDENPIGDHFPEFAYLVKTTFNKRRKKISNSIKTILIERDINIEELPKPVLDLLDKRAEHLSKEDYVLLFNELFLKN